MVKDRVRAAFDRFFFEYCDQRVASRLRIGFAILLIIYFAALVPDAARWFSDEGVLSAETSRRMTGDAHASILFAATPTSLIHAGLGLMLAQSFLLLLGCWSRFQVACIFVGLVMFQHRNLMVMDGEDVVFRWFALLMIFLPLDHRWSLARWLSGRTSGATMENAWAIRLIQLQTATIFLSSAGCKLLGQTWRDGSAMHYIANSQVHFGRLPIPVEWFDVPWLSRSLTWWTVAVELLVPCFIWFPRFRNPCLVLAIGLHLGIELTMNLFLFQWIMIVGWMSFSSPKNQRDQCHAGEPVDYNKGVA